MGTGSFDNGKFNFVITGSDQWSASDKSDWMERFTEASRQLHEASEGQLSFGNIFMADEGWGRGGAEFITNAFPGTAYATFGHYGRLGRSVQLFDDHRTGDARTIVHEFGHHGFGLGDEYTGPVSIDTIDTEGTIPGPNGQPLGPDDAIPPDTLFNTVPLVASEVDSQSLAYGYAILTFGAVIERRIIASHSPTELVLSNGFTADPRTADGARIFYQPQYNYDESPNGIVIRCVGSGVNAPNYCLMDKDGPDAVIGEVTEFCSASNHDPNHDTSHDARHGGLSCWEVMAQTMLDRYGHTLTVPDPALSGDVTIEQPEFFELLKEARIALVMDRSGSMREGNKIEGVRVGVEQWMSEAHLNNDQLSVIWFNDSIETKLDLTQVAPGDVPQLVEEVTDVAAQGYTNIRDALFAAVAQIQSPEGRAALEAIVVLTDGIHNRPLDSTVAEVIPTLQDAGIPVIVIALGGPENIDYEVLEELTVATGGLLLQTGNLDAGAFPFPINLLLNIANNTLRNGLIVAGEAPVGGAPPGSELSEILAGLRKKRIRLDEVAKALEVDEGIKGLIRERRRSWLSVPFLVEDGATAARFALSHVPKQDFLLYLVDPDGKEVDFDDSELATLIDPASPFTSAHVAKPAAGLWHAVAIRTSPGASTGVGYVAGADNRMIHAFADCDPVIPAGQSVAINAGASWRDRLSGLRVSARLTGPDGSIHKLSLSDETEIVVGSGEYRGVFTPALKGRYEGEVRITARKGTTRQAGAMHRIMHQFADNPNESDDEKSGSASLDIGSDAPTFVRRVPIYFDVGERPKPKDKDQLFEDRKKPPIRKRKRPLKPIRLERGLEKSPSRYLR